MSRPLRSGSSLGVRWADAVCAVDPPHLVRVSSLAADRLPGSVGRRLKSERRFAVFVNGPRRVLDLSQCLLIGLYLKLSITYSKIWKDSNGAREE